MGVLGKIRSSLGGGPSGEARANTLLGEALAARHRGDLDTAVARLHQAIAIAPHLPEPHFWLGRCQLRQNQDEQAAKSLSAALKRAPAYPLALHCQVFLAVAHSRLNLARGDTDYLPFPALPAAPPMISVIICSIDEARFEQVSAQYHRLLEAVPHEIIGIHDATSLCQGYNRGFGMSRGEILVFSHDDVQILTPDFAARLVASLAGHDLVGVVGSAYLSGATWFGSGWPHLRGQVGVPADSGTGTVANFFGLYGTFAEGVQAMDGFFLAARRSLCLKLPFDEKTFDGWHLYDIDFSFSAHLKGFRCAVANDQVMIHHSRGKFGDKWDFYRNRFLEKYEGQLTFTGPASYAQLDPPAINMPSNEVWLAITRSLVLAAHAPG